MSTWATFEDIKDAAFGLTIPDTDQESIEYLIDKAQLRLTSRMPNLAARIAAQTLDAALVRGVLEDIVLRVVRNPAAYRQVTVDGATMSLDRANASGLIEITPADIAQLQPAVTPGRPRGVGSIRLGMPITNGGRHAF